jgi:hypothetical protein
MLMIKKTNFQFSDTVIREVGFLLTTDDVVVLNNPTGDFFYDPWTIKDEYKDTVFDKLLSVLPNIGQARLIKLISGDTYHAHADIDDRYHMSITGNYCYLIDLDNNTMYSVPVDGCWYLMDAGRLHVASNFGELYRYQLVVRQLLSHSSSNDLVQVTVESKIIHDKLRYYFDTTLSGWLNRANKRGLLDNFKATTTPMSCTMLLDRSLVEELKNTVHHDFEVLTN